MEGELDFMLLTTGPRLLEAKAEEGLRAGRVSIKTCWF